MTNHRLKLVDAYASRRTIAIVISVLLIWVIWAAFPARQTLAAQASSARSVRDGVFTAAQAERGASVYLDECARCHGETLGGGENNTPPLIGKAFVESYEGLSVGDLFERTRLSMPKESPGRLSGRQYADVLAHVLQSNKYPVGASELPTDVAELKAIAFVAPAP